ncbi:MAG: hydroxyethylthiazole kinase [Anaerovoracaceae bacterium]|jgi:hydroxyethylthiazole kinase
MIDLGKRLAAVRETTPLTMCITNFVTVNDCANIILAAGGTPSMPTVVDEIEESAEGSAALVCNMGAIEDHRAMVLAGRRANELGRPVVLDPVAVGGTRLRRNASAELFDSVRFAAVRGNASEIKFIASQQCGAAEAVHESESGNAGFTESGFVSGVDASDLDVVTDSNLKESAAVARQLATKTGAVIAISGATDLVAEPEQDGGRIAVIRNGCATMSRITGSGCMVTSLIGSFCGANTDSAFDATVTAMVCMGAAGEIAEEKRLQNGTGNASFRTDLIDAVFNMTGDTLEKYAKVEML